MFKRLFFCFFILLALSPYAKALDFTKKNDFITITSTPEYKSISKSTDTLNIISTVNIKPDWHIYWHNPGDSGDPTTLIYYDSPYYDINETWHSAPQKSVFNDLITIYIHKEKMYYKTEFKLKNLQQQTSLSFKQVLSYTICKEECLPQKLTLNITLPITDNQEPNPNYLKQDLNAENTFPIPLKSRINLQNEKLELQIADTILKQCEKPEFISWHQKKSILSNLPTTQISEHGNIEVAFDKGETPPDTKGVLLCKEYAYDIKSTADNTSLSSFPKKEASKNLIYYLLTAFLAGLILNLMPCVLPILSLKALYLAAHKEKSSPVSAMIYLAGVLLSFLTLSGLLFYLRRLGTGLGWGFQLQSPIFNIFLILLFFIIFLSLIDKLQIPDIFADKLSKLANNKSFLTGFFAVIIACPCTGPFMGAALGYAMTEPTLIYFSIFLSLGFGYALPYVLIETFPNFFLKFIPAPGKWMITLKHILSIPIALTCLWLIWVTYNQLHTNTKTTDILWEDYTPQKVEQSLKNNEAVFIDFTAKWCLICLLNDKTALSTDTFKKLVKTNNIHLYKADWTNHSKEISDALKQYNRNSIPLYVYYKKADKTPQYLPQILTTDILKNTLSNP